MLYLIDGLGSILKWNDAEIAEVVVTFIKRQNYDI